MNIASAGQNRLFCPALATPRLLFNRRYAAVSQRLNQGLNDRVEREVDALTEREPEAICTPCRRLAHWRVCTCSTPRRPPGASRVNRRHACAHRPSAACAVGRHLHHPVYVWNFGGGLDSVPLLVQQISLLHDIGVRMRVGEVTVFLSTHHGSSGVGCRMSIKSGGINGSLLSPLIR